MRVKPSPIVKNKVRILRPVEFKALESEVLKLHHRIMLQTLLFTGMRYIECKRLQQNPKWFDGDFIKISFGAGINKKQIRNKERWIRLNSLGKMAVTNYLNLKDELPSNQTWRENMIRWGDSAGIETVGLCPKTTRKTWESWLMFFFETKPLQILLSQGHTGEISLKHYLNMPFTKQDKLEMEEYVGGWI